MLIVTKLMVANVCGFQLVYTYVTLCIILLLVAIQLPECSLCTNTVDTCPILLVNAM